MFGFKLFIFRARIYKYFIYIGEKEFASAFVTCRLYLVNIMQGFFSTLTKNT